MELRNSVNATFGVELPATATFDHPTTTALAAFIASRIAPTVQVWIFLRPQLTDAHCPQVLISTLITSATLQRLPLDSSMAGSAAGFGRQTDGHPFTDIVSTSSTLATAVDQSAGKLCNLLLDSVFVCRWSVQQADRGF